MGRGRGGSSPPWGRARGGTSRTRTTTPRPHPGVVGGRQRENLRCWLARVEGENRQVPKWAPKGRNPRRELEGYSGRGQGKGLLGEGGVPGRIETRRGPIVFEGDRGGSCRRKGRSATSGDPRRRRENPPGRNSQRPPGLSIRVRAGRTPGGSGSGMGPPGRPPGLVIPLPRGWAAGRRPRGNSTAYEARTNNCRAEARREGEAAGATPTGGQGARGQPPTAGKRRRPPTSVQEGTSFCP